MAAERVVLMVDYMEPMLAIASDFLQRRLDCVRVVTFQRPTEALEWLRTAHDRVDLILSDNHMGEMDGLTFLEKAKALRPEAARVLMTAYLDISATPPQLGARGVHALVRKPWEWNDFGRAMFELLAFPQDERARAEREGPVAYPEGAFAEFAASRKASRGSSAPPSPAPPAPPAPAGDSSPGARHDDGSAPAAPPQPIAPARVIAAAGLNRLACPHCLGMIDVELQVPRGTAANEDDAARRLLAYLQAQPGVAQRMRAIVAAQGQGPRQGQRQGAAPR